MNQSSYRSLTNDKLWRLNVEMPPICYLKSQNVEVSVVTTGTIELNAVLF